jgi:hypothetical protein
VYQAMEGEGRLLIGEGRGYWSASTCRVQW